jgi:hypothetical protein
MESDSIYNYYDWVSDRFYAALCIPDKGKGTIQFIWEPLARKAVILGFRDFDFFIMGKRGYFELYEGLSGSIIIKQSDMRSRILRRCTCELFINHLPGEIRKRGGKANLNQAVINFLWDNDQKYSPRYIAKKV